MAEGSDLLDEVFFNTEVDEEVVSNLVGSLESELSGWVHGNPWVRCQTVVKHSSGTGGNSNVQQSKRGLAQGVAKAGMLLQWGVISNTRSQSSAMDASSAESDSSAGHGQSNTVAVSANIIAPLPNHGGKVGTSAPQTLNGGNIMNFHNSGSAVSLTVVNNGPGLSNEHSSAEMSTSSNTVIQTSFVNSRNVVTTSQAASLATGPTVTLVRPSMQTAGAGTSLNGNTNTGLPAAVNVACQAITTTAPGMAIQTSLLNNGQSPSSVAVSATSHIIKAEAPKTIIQTAPGVVTNPSFQSAPRTPTPVTVAANPGAIRAIAPQVLAPRLPQTSPNQPNVQNIQLPPGMVLVRSESGQLLMIHQQTLAQMQAQSHSQGAMAPRPATPTSTAQVQITSVQAPGTPILSRQLAPTSTTIIKQGMSVPTCAPITTTLQRPPVLQVQVQIVVSWFVRLCLSEGVFHSSTMGASYTKTHTVPAVFSLFQKEGKIEAEDFTSRLYRELNSSPQPYLVPFLKRSLPALRKLTPDSARFIEQSGLQQQTSAPTPQTVVLGSPPPRPAAPSMIPNLQPVNSKQGQPASLVLQPQQQGAMVRPLQMTPMVTLRGQHPHSRIVLGQPQVKRLPMVPMVKPGVLSGSKLSSGAASPATAVQQNKLKEAGGTFRDDDDINDVASMAGVNLSEESARILATNSELVGAVTRSCKDEAFLHASALTRRILEMGKKFGVSDLGPEVVSYVSHATQTRLTNLLEKVSEVAQQRNINLKEDSRYEQTSDVRAQLKFFEQLDQMEKQRREEQQREILMKAAKSRSRQEDPEQLRLKQKAKEMQQQELFQLRQKEANLTALAAIGPRKKRRTEAAGSGSSPSASGSGSSGASRQFVRQRITRVNLRDLLFCLENERDTSHSHLLYRGFLK
uniref:TAFH domain-containing protein n=1 Tax=Esox lucius TaxID=8010 RepID=A0A6Q2XPK2_ESOLU